MAFTKITGPGIHTLSNIMSHNVKSSGIITAVNGNLTGWLAVGSTASFGGNVSIGGTLTYDDVTYVESVGIVTAKGGLHVGAGGTIIHALSEDNGKVGIGSEIPTQLLDVAGTVKADDISIGGASITNSSGTALDFNGSITASDVITAGALLHEGDTHTLVHFSAGDTIELKTGGSSRLEVTNSGLSLQNGYLNSNGNRIILGDSTGTTHNRIVLGNSDDLFLYHDSADSYIENNTGKLRILGNDTIQLGDGTDQVGIGTSTPGTQLHLYGSTPILRLTDTDTSGPIHTNIDGASGYLTLDVGSVHRDVIITSVDQANEIARFTGDGNVGIGTANPDDILHLCTDANSNVTLKIEPGTTAGNYSEIVLGRTSSAPHRQTTPVVKGGVPISGVPGILFGSENTNLPAIAFQTPNSSDGHIVFKPKGSEKVRITSTGNVQLQGGIIYGDDNASNVFTLQSTSGNSNHSRIEIGASQSSDNGGIHFYTAGSSTATRHMTLKGTTGYLGIGVDDPNNPLTIHGSSNHIYMKDTATNNILQIRHSSGVAEFNSFDLDGSARRDFVFNQYATEVFRIRTSGNISVPDGEIETKQDYPDFRPTLDFNFAAVKKLDSRIKYTRTGYASYYNEYGLLEIVNADVPRFTHDPDTRESLGLLVEESRTNLITNSDHPGPNTPNLGGAAQTNGTADGIILPTGQTGTVREFLAFSGGGGIRFGDFSGTNNTTYSGSLWVRTASGTGSVIIDMNDGGGNTQSLSTQWKRLTATHAVNDTYRFIDLYFGTPVTVYIWGVQIEAAPNVSSYIPTRGVAGTRGPDLVVIDGQNFTDFYNPVESTVLAVGTIQRPASAQGQLNIVHIGDSNEDGHGIFREHGTKDVWYHIRNNNSTPSGGNLNPNGFGDWDKGEEARIAAAFKDGDQAISVNGGNQITATVTSSYPTADITKMWIGSHGNGSYFDGTISRIAYYGKQLTDSQLNTLTAR